MKILAVAPAMLSLGIWLSGSAHAQTPDIRVINEPEDPVNTAHVSDNLPFATSRTINGAAGEQTFIADLFFEELVPEGFRFIVTQVSMSVQVSPGIRAKVEIFAGDKTGMVGIRVPIPVLSTMTYSHQTPVPGFPGMTIWTPQTDYLIGDSPVHFALEHGRGVGIAVVKSTSTGSTFGWITLQGHLVPIAQTRGQ